MRGGGSDANFNDVIFREEIFPQDFKVILKKCFLGAQWCSNIQRHTIMC